MNLTPGQYIRNPQRCKGQFSLLIHQAGYSSLNMMKFAVLFALVAAAAADPILRLNPLSSTGRIVGGRPTTIQEHPHQASVQFLGRHICGGNIIGEKHILTAAHCLGYPPQLYSARVGSTYSDRGGLIFGVSRFIRHENYTTNRFGIPENDIALIILNSLIPFSFGISPISIYPNLNEPSPDSKAVISGWGATKEGGRGTNVLQSAEVNVVKRADCNKAYQALGGVPPGQMCAGEAGADACQGDSGGPLVIERVLFGIVSWGIGCARGFPGVYTSVPDYRVWINNNSGL